MAYIDGTITDEAGRRSANVIHRGSAMVAPITRQGRFSGLHITYLDDGGGKLEISDPITGEALPAKKVRGSKAGSEIKLITCASDKPVERIVLGEGIETVLSVWCAMAVCEIDLTTTEFWSAIDLGNLGGKASAQIVHPILRTAAGGPRRVPGPDPDFSSPAIVIPDSVREVVILGDSDSDPVTTQCAIHRAAERFRAARADRIVKAAFPNERMDFNGMLTMTG
jgi:hypothetical protein